MKSTRPLSNLVQLVDQYSRYHPSAITLAQLVDFSKKRDEQESYRFLHREIPVRLSHMIKELQLLPENLRQKRSVKLVEDMYWKSFEDLKRFTPEGAKDEQTLSRFTRRLAEIKQRHSNVVETMAEGIIALRNESENRCDPSLNYFLDRFYTSRISIRALMSNHLVLFGPLEEVPGCYGILDPQLNVVDIVEEATSNARYLCNHYYHTCPDIQINVFNKNGLVAEGEKVIMTYIASHLHHMAFELIKNALRASVERKSGDTIPPVKIRIVQGDRDLCIKVSDRGHGIPMRLHDQLFQYHYSTAPEPDKDSHIPPLAGFGYGLPLSRLYARYLNGNLKLMSLDGYGTDAVIYLQSFNEDAGEVLPLFNKTSRVKYQIGSMVHDWNVAGSKSKPIWSAE